NQCRPRGSEALPAGIVSSTSSFETRPLWDIPAVRKKHHQRRQVVSFSMCGKDFCFRMRTFSFRMRTLEFKSSTQIRIYISIIKSEGLEISQPALDPQLSERRTYKIGGCDLSSTAPPCT
ncbi:hypothetical protein S83_066404, partial [Arachis hypogaea]